MTVSNIVREKTDQAVETLEETNVDAWITFGRDTADAPDPMQPLILGEEFIWPGMVLLTRGGRKIVICESHDAGNIQDLGLFDVRPYEESLESAFSEAIEEVDPETIAVNYSRSDSTADGLSHGLYLELEHYLEGTEYHDALTGAEDVIAGVRGRKSSTELERIQKAVDLAQEFLEQMRRSWQPSWSEADVAAFLHEQIDDHEIETAWERSMCPVVTAGAEADHGHAKPSSRTLPRGEVLRLDFGVVYEEYCSDMQRLYYYPEEGETSPPAELQSAFEDVRAAIAAGFDALEPGVEGHEVDRAARDVITERGWPEFKHGLGHQVGRRVHDGGAYLGPTWERYGEAPYREVSEGEVFTIELGIETQWGYLAQEEMARVTESGATYLTEPQRELKPLVEA
ncbi:M24 family metallopeptidase [Halorussus sp. AFM4]|uniref:M24 family metallopeptidase n=1 Tax=Halorussus sp. AFM4 TaxID=3421651 RepID=UPI003EBC036F